MKFFMLISVLTLIATSIAVDFFLLTPENKNNPAYIFPNNASKQLKAGLEVQILIHGWNTNMNKTFYRNMSAALFTRGNYNIILVDYSTISEGLYPVAVLETRKMAAEIKGFIVNLVQNGFPLKTIYIIGHSLGAEIAGYIGEYIFSDLGQKLSRVTGLDPAGPGFYARHLNASDALMVYVIHSAMGTEGIALNIGSTDVYVNGGVYQPGCFGLNFASCSHGRAHEYFTFALANPGSLVAAKCKNNQELVAGRCNNTKKIDLGGTITSKDRGKFYLTTSSGPPFVTILPPK